MTQAKQETKTEAKKVVAKKSRSKKAPAKNLLTEFRSLNVENKRLLFKELISDLSHIEMTMLIKKMEEARIFGDTQNTMSFNLQPLNLNQQSQYPGVPHKINEQNQIETEITLTPPKNQSRDVASRFTSIKSIFDYYCRFKNNCPGTMEYSFNEITQQKVFKCSICGRTTRLDDALRALRSVPLERFVDSQKAEMGLKQRNLEVVLEQKLMV